MNQPGNLVAAIHSERIQKRVRIAFFVLAMLAWPASCVVDWALPASHGIPANSEEAKTAVLKLVPPGSTIDQARGVMIGLGFYCPLHDESGAKPRDFALDVANCFYTKTSGPLQYYEWNIAFYFSADNRIADLKVFFWTKSVQID